MSPGFNFKDGPDAEIKVAQYALDLAIRFQPGLSLDRYKSHLDKLCKALATLHQNLLDAGAADDVGTQLAALKQLIVEQEGYDIAAAEEPASETLSLIRTIEQRKGAPLCLALLYIHAARARGWDVRVISFPTYVICRIEKGGQRLLFDPGENCALLKAPDLRRIAKNMFGEQAELLAEYYGVLGPREILVRLQNAIKTRQIEDEDYMAALETVQITKSFAPDEYRLLLDEGVLLARTGQIEQAIDALESYLSEAPRDVNCHDASLLLDELKNMPR